MKFEETDNTNQDQSYKSLIKRIFIPGLISQK